MVSSQRAEFGDLERVVRGEFNYSRTLNEPPQLPPGYDWDTQIHKYCPKWYYQKLGVRTKMRFHDEYAEKREQIWQSRLEEIRQESKRKGPFDFSRSKWERLKSTMYLGDDDPAAAVLRDRMEDIVKEPKSGRFFSFSKSKPQHAQAEMPKQSPEERLTDDRRVAVFCHRAFYDQALKIPENSRAAIENGIHKGLLLHELDARLGPGIGPNQTFLAHDEVAQRITPTDRRWSAISLTEVWETALATRRFDLTKNDYASSVEQTGELMPNLEKLLLQYTTGSRNSGGYDGCTFQIDLRGNDLTKAIAWFHTQEYRNPKLMLKGYNITFESGQSLLAAVDQCTTQNYGKRFSWSDLDAMDLPIILVFYSEAITNLALKERGVKDLLLLEYEDLLRTTKRHVQSFFAIGGNLSRPVFIPEIVHSGLGLGYDIQTKVARDPLTGSIIKDPEVVFKSRLDRAMIEVSLLLREENPTLMSSGCTRLCEVRTEDGRELTAAMTNGRLREKAKGEAGIAARCREIHGGLFPRSDIVVADDPFAEIAARTWIDEYAKLDRRELLWQDYYTWLRSAGSEVYEAVKKLQGPFLANTVTSRLNSEWNFQMPAS
ncbi:hypothetical protein K458DRAFT_436446 [Lentithecium fluviatile CBS 122367]|uniref:Uncharacterized protein n=1 Tax=Lentithecium fluviatile CBS 122367 TaxID=1168545 RepID=A0A6G1IHJ9_9PLEO|nr:hypothetical protein K458DRAFT_436446 [Lentithecium fluviatile CBS 122367]